MLRYFGSMVLVLVAFGTLQAQKGLRIEGKIANAKPSMLVLVQYFGGDLMPIDTAIIGNDGRVVWEDKEGIPAGMCRILGIGRGMDIVVADSQRFSFEADMKDPIASIRFQNSPENTLFFNYQREVRTRYQRALSYRQQMGIKDDNDPRWKTRFRELNEEIKKHVDSLYKKYPQSFAVHFLKSYQEPKLPVLPLKILSPKDSAYLQSYAREHFFDNSFLSDERMVYTPTVPVRFERLLKTIPSLPKEEQLKLVEKTIQQTKGTVELRKYIVGKFAQQFELTPSASLDEVYQLVVQKYVIGEPGLWDASTLQKVKEVSAIKAKLAVGSPFPSLRLTDLTENERALEAVKSDYTVLYFYDPGCTHCRETTPKLTALANRYADKLQVYAVSLDADATVLKKFTEEFNTQNFINVRDTTRKIEFYTLGVFNYPTVYLLDRDKKMVARWLSVEQLASYLLNR
ncbi:TlpA family protein disulfide reductase [Runella slithyformis]|nr:TlpA family protein disulfide reductase [Runella slithyformis]